MARLHLFDAKRSGRVDWILRAQPPVKPFIHRQLLENNEQTARELQLKIEERFGVHLSESRVKLYRRQLGWRYANVKYGQMVRVENRVKRIDWCHQYKDYDFSHCVFADETTVQLECHRRRCFALKGEKLLVIK